MRIGKDVLVFKMQMIEDIVGFENIVILNLESNVGGLCVYSDVDIGCVLMSVSYSIQCKKLMYFNGEYFESV